MDHVVPIFFFLMVFICFTADIDIDLSEEEKHSGTNNPNKQGAVWQTCFVICHLSHVKMPSHFS